MISATNKPLQEFDECGDLQSFPIDHETQFSAVRDRRDHAGREACRLSSSNGGAALRCITPSTMVLATDACLIAPMNAPSFSFSAFCNGRISFLQPLFNGRGLLFIGTLAGALRSESPSRQVITNRSEGHLDAIGVFDQFLHSLACPQCERHLQLLRRFVDNHSLHMTFLIWVKRSTRSLGASSFAQAQFTHASPTIKTPPLADYPSGDLKQFGHFVMRMPFSFQRYRSSTQLKLCVRAQLPCISSFHARKAS